MHTTSADDSATTLLAHACFQNDDDALLKLEGIEWPEAPVCPRCAHKGPVYDLSKTRFGLKKCRKCSAQFTVRVGTVLQGSHLPLHLWLQAVFLLTAGEKPVSSLRLSRTLGISYKSAWLLTHRIRDALNDQTNKRPH
ncbi:MAG: IS1595 family transposase [Alphaproteobacteria bacterium]|nr:IS1595 family transposase [Alphaproteobacteria bacterium]